MTIWGIADIHASQLDPDTQRPEKPMDVFGPQWEDHVRRLETAWRDSVESTDTVIVAGDIDWALHLADALETLTFLESLPGNKILLRGNHDYWWSSKTTNRVRRMLPPSLDALHNTAYEAEGFNICGAKGSPVPGGLDWTPENEKLLNRELQRLQRSLELRRPELPTVVAMHYPPFFGSEGESPYREMIESSEASCVIYGHLHGQAATAGPRGSLRGIEYRLVAGDATGFRLVQIAHRGVLTLSTSPDARSPVS